MRARISLTGPVLLLAALVATSCGEDDSPSSRATAATVSTIVSPASAPAVTGSPSSRPAESVPTLGLADACSLVPPADAAAAAELELGTGVPDGDERRRVCTFNTADGVGVTVGVQPGGRFEQKADASRTALGVDGEPVDDLGDEALFFYSDEDIPEGVGGTLVAVGDLTIDVTVQGLDEPATRAASNGLAGLAVDRL